MLLVVVEVVSGCFGDDDKEGKVDQTPSDGVLVATLVKLFVHFCKD